MPATFCEASEVREIANRLIAEYHGHLNGIRIDYVFRSDTPKKNGKAVWGTAQKKGNLDAYLAGQEDEGFGHEAFFVITISRPIWDKLTYEQREALVDHELCHCWREDEADEEGRTVTKLSLNPHDLEEFTSVYYRHGDWRPDLEQFERVASERVATLRVPRRAA